MLACCCAESQDGTAVVVDKNKLVTPMGMEQAPPASAVAQPAVAPAPAPEPPPAPPLEPPRPAPEPPAPKPAAAEPVAAATQPEPVVNAQAEAALKDEPKVAQTEEFKPEVTEWKVNIVKDSQASMMGFALTCHFQRVALVQCIKDGLVSKFNQTCKPADCIEAGDFLIAVNDASDDTDKMIALFKSSNEITLTMRRVKKFQAKVKTEGGLGLQLNKETLIVQQVNRGNVKDYNREAVAGHQILMHDKIVSVDGKTGSSEEIWNMICESASRQEATLTINR